MLQTTKNYYLTGPFRKVYWVCSQTITLEYLRKYTFLEVNLKDFLFSVSLFFLTLAALQSCSIVMHLLYNHLWNTVCNNAITLSIVPFFAAIFPMGWSIVLFCLVIDNRFLKTKVAYFKRPINCIGWSFKSLYCFILKYRLKGFNIAMYNQNHLITSRKSVNMGL